MRRVLTSLLRLYKRWLSPALPVACRFQPTCSEYAQEAVQVHGAARGVWLAIRRLLRCHPLGGYGYDPVPLPHTSASALVSGKQTSGAFTDSSAERLARL